MNEKEFRKYLKRGGRSESAISRILLSLNNYQKYLAEHRSTKTLDQSSPQDFKDFMSHVEINEKAMIKTYLWAIPYYYEYTSNNKMTKLIRNLRVKRIKKPVYALRKFRGVKKEHADRLTTQGIRNTEQMLEAGGTPAKRRRLSGQTGIPQAVILELVKLSDLARIPGIKGIRARLYVDAGVDTIEKMAKVDPKILREKLIDFVKKTKFDGIAPLPKELIFSIERAKQLPKIVKY